MLWNNRHYIKKYILFVSGIILFITGIIGLFLPVMPTVPFILLSVSCFYKSSRRFHSWLINNKLFGKFVRDYTEEKKIGKKTKIFSLILLWLSIGFSIYRFWHKIYIPIIHLIIIISISIHIIKLGKSAGNDRSCVK